MGKIKDLTGQKFGRFTVEIQDSNKRPHRKITCDGEVHTISEWSRITGISRTVITKRLKNGWSEHDAIKTKTVDLRKPLIAKNPATGEIFNFESTKDAERQGHTRSSIWRCITGEYKTHHGMIWEYES